MAHKGLWTEAHVRQGDSEHGPLPHQKHAARGKKERGLNRGLKGTFQLKTPSSSQSSHGNVPSEFRTSSWRARAAPSLSRPLFAMDNWGGALRLGQLCTPSVGKMESGELQPPCHSACPWLRSWLSCLCYPEFPEKPGQNQPNKSCPK